MTFITEDGNGRQREVLVTETRRGLIYSDGTLRVRARSLRGLRVRLQDREIAILAQEVC